MIASMVFTKKYAGKTNTLAADIVLMSNARDKACPFMPQMWKAIWDTGATKSCITQKVVDNMKLTPVGKTNISTANGTTVVNTYLVDIVLPNGVLVKDVLVSCANLGPELDALLGMDIITLGDFSISNFNDKTTFSFRIPSEKDIDFQKD